MLVNLAELPLEILEQIVSQLDPEEVVSSVSKINQRFAQVAYNVICNEFRALAPLIDQQLREAKGKFEAVSTQNTFETGMIEVSNLTVYQILQSEYKVVCTVYFTHKDLDSPVLVFNLLRSLKEFAKLLLQEVNLREMNVLYVLDRVRGCNDELLDCFFEEVWNPRKDYMGLLILKFLSCSLCSSYDLTVSYERNPKFKNSKCHIAGHYEITDLSNILSKPPTGLHEMDIDSAAKALTNYIGHTIRSGNSFHSLRLRWICMDRAMAMRRTAHAGQTSTDPPVADYLGAKGFSIAEREHELRNGEVKVVRRLTKAPDPTYTQVNTWTGTKVGFQLWCRANEAPEEMFSTEYWAALQDLPDIGDSPVCTWPYQFNMEYNVTTFSRDLANHSRNQGHIKTTIWVEENASTATFNQVDQFVR